jgi:hypothetical protein
MFILYCTKNKKDAIVAEYNTKEEAMSKGNELFAKAEKGDTFTLVEPFNDGISFSSDGQIVGKYKFYHYWY